MGPAERHRHRRDIQMIFQDPLAALNPRMTAEAIIGEPLVTHEPRLTRAEVKTRVGEIMERVGLLPGHLNRYPHEFSGGQCQRINIARALIVRPRLLICDEPVSALDTSVQAQIINLLRDLKRDLGLSLIFIAHDLQRGQAHLGPDHGLLSRPGDGVRHRARSRRPPPASLLARPHRGRPDSGPRGGARAAERGAERRAALSARAPFRLRLPDPLPGRSRRLRAGEAGALGFRRRTPRRVPLRRGRLSPDLDPESRPRRGVGEYTSETCSRANVPAGAQRPRSPSLRPAVAPRRRCNRHQPHRHGPSLRRCARALERRAPGPDRAPAPELHRGRRGHRPHEQLRRKLSSPRAARQPGARGRAQRGRRPHRAPGRGRERAPDPRRRLHGPHRRALRTARRPDDGPGL